MRISVAVPPASLCVLACDHRRGLNVSARLVELTTKTGRWVAIDPSTVRAVVAAEGGGSLIWFGYGHEVICKEEPEIISRMVGLDLQDTQPGSSGSPGVISSGAGPISPQRRHEP